MSSERGRIYGSKVGRLRNKDSVSFLYIFLARYLGKERFKEVVV